MYGINYLYYVTLQLSYNFASAVQNTSEIEEPSVSSADSVQGMTEASGNMENTEKVETEVDFVDEAKVEKRVTFVDRPTYSTDNNWPPLPAIWCIKPCFYQNIIFDIPSKFHHSMYTLYSLWKLHGMVYFLNIIGGIMLLDVEIIALGILYFIGGVTLSYITWFRSAYKAFNQKSHYYFAIFCIFYSMQFCFTLIHLLGIPYTGTIGLLTALYNKNKQLSECLGYILTAVNCSMAIMDFLVVYTALNHRKKISEFFRVNTAVEV